jgi:hypothetical protein
MRLRQEGGEITPSAWLGGAGFAVGLAALPFGFLQWVPLTSAIVLGASFGVVSGACLFASGRQFYINVGRDQTTAAALPPKSPAPVPPPGLPSSQPSTPPAPAPAPVVVFVAFDVNAPLMANRHGAYRRLPSDGDLRHAMVAAFRHRSGPNAVLTAHLQYVAADKTIVHVHAGAWVGATAESLTLGSSQTAELILAVHSPYGYYYILDVSSSGTTHKTVPYGTYAAILELDVWRSEPIVRTFDLTLTKNANEMKVGLRTLADKSSPSSCDP